jgi:hypothetical protein
VTIKATQRLISFPSCNLKGCERGRDPGRNDDRLTCPSVLKAAANSDALSGSDQQTKPASPPGFWALKHFNSRSLMSGRGEATRLPAVRAVHGVPSAQATVP